METISKRPVRILAGLLAEYGVRHIIVSSGSRCAPLSVAFGRFGRFRLHPVIDERSAAFVALGMSLTLDEPVGIVCTSGSAPLNYAPALAEAFYRRVPLVAITADRPWWWVGQREGQTIKQAHALDAVVRCSVNLMPDESAENLAAINRLANKALQAATGCLKGPVHINVQLDAPLTVMAEGDGNPCWRKISNVYGTPAVPENLALPVSSDADVLVLVGDNHFDDAAKEAIRCLSGNPDVMVLAEAQANLPWAMRPAYFERAFDDDTFPRPGLIVSLGGSLVSNGLKRWLRSFDVPHISIGTDDEPVDTFGSLVMTLNMPELQGILWLNRQLSTNGGKEPYSDRCMQLCVKPESLSFLKIIAGHLKAGIIHISNGMSIRLAQNVDWSAGVRLECNRGVSGIEGSTSTAIGAAMATEKPVLLISGDMSAAYDISALALPSIPSSFRMVVLDNGGGDIFRRIPTTRDLPELDTLFVMQPRLPLRQLAGAYGFSYFEYNSEEETFPIEFFNSSDKPAILRIIMK